AQQNERSRARYEATKAAHDVEPLEARTNATRRDHAARLNPRRRGGCDRAREENPAGACKHAPGERGRVERERWRPLARAFDRGSEILARAARERGDGAGSEENADSQRDRSARVGIGGGALRGNGSRFSKLVARPAGAAPRRGGDGASTEKRGKARSKSAR